jgi:hypothetical protein
MVARRMGPRSSRPPEEDAALDRVAREAREHEQAQKLGALAYDVLVRQADARVLFTGREFADKRAAEHGVSRDEARTAEGNLLGILERGAEGEEERALVVCFALVGFEAEHGKSAAEEKANVAQRFARQVDWLEAATPYAIWTLVDRVVSPAVSKAFWQAVAQSVVDDGGERGRAPKIRGRNAARIAALAAAAEAPKGSAAKEALALVSSSRLDPVGAALVGAVADAAPQARTASISGEIRGVRARGALRVLSLVSGYALLRWCVRGVARLCGVRREAKLALGTAGIELTERMFAFGREVRERKDTVALSAVLTAGREVRWASAHLYVGAIALAIGVLVGGTWIFEGARSGELVLLSVGAGLMLAGALLDLGLDVLVPAGRGRVSVELALHRGRKLRVDGITIEEADRFLDALRAAR